MTDWPEPWIPATQKIREASYYAYQYPTNHTHRVTDPELVIGTRKTLAACLVTGEYIASDTTVPIER